MPPPGPATPPRTVPQALATAVVDPAAPVLTWYDDATGDRVELSGTTLGNWIAKTANLLVDGCGLQPGDVVLVDAPPHWQTAVVLLGCWSAGLVVTVPAPADGGPAWTGSVEDPPAVVFAAADRAAGHLETGAEVYGLALAPMAAPMTDPPPGVTDFVTEVRAYGDHFSPVVPVGPQDPATAVDHATLCRQAGEVAAAHGIGAGARVLVDADRHPSPLDWLLAPLVAGASTVLCAHLDPGVLERRGHAERVTVVVA